MYFSFVNQVYTLVVFYMEIEYMFLMEFFLMVGTCILSPYRILPMYKNQLTDYAFSWNLYWSNVHMFIQQNLLELEQVTLRKSDKHVLEKQQINYNDEDDESDGNLSAHGNMLVKLLTLAMKSGREVEFSTDFQSIHIHWNWELKPIWESVTWCIHIVCLL